MKAASRLSKMKKIKPKVLFVAHMDSHIANFHLPYLKWFQDHGYETHVVSNDAEVSRPILYCDVKHQLSFSRSPYSPKNIKVYKAFKKLIKENNFALVHAHTAMGGLIARLGLRKSKVPLFYTAHGFHFYKGGPLLSWLFYYPVEKYLSRFTDVLLTINKEDYLLAKTKFTKTNVALVDGVGIDFTKFNDEKSDLTFTHPLVKDEDFLLVSIGELNDNKNQMFVIKAVQKLLVTNRNIKYIMAGYGQNKEKYEQYIQEHNLENNIILTGFLPTLTPLLKRANVLVSASKREGQGLNVIEAMYMKVIPLVSNVRGHADLIEHNINGFLFDLTSVEDFLAKLAIVMQGGTDLLPMKENALKTALKYDIKRVLPQVTALYSPYLVKKEIQENE